MTARRRPGAASHTRSSPSRSWAGLSEVEAQKAGKPFHVGRFSMADSGRARDLGRPEGFIKVLIGRDGHVLGAAALCEQGAEVVQLIAAGGTVREMLEAVHIHPTLAEAAKNAVRAAMED